MGKYICPCCFSKNDEKELEYKCRKCGNVFSEKNGSLNRDGKCTNCGATTNLRRCHRKECHFELPYTFGSYQDETFSVIGLKESGKSHFIGMLVKIFARQIGEPFHVSMEIVHDDISAKFKNMYAGSLDRGTVIRETIAANVNNEIRKPLIYKLLFRTKGVFGNKKLKIATMSLFDNAGEDLFNESMMRQVNQCVFNSTGIILIVDPLQLPPVREELKVRGISLPQEHANNANGGTKEILIRVAKLIREQRKLSQNQLIDIPIAIAFSKSDALKDIIGESDTMFKESNHDGALNKGEIMSISSEIKNLISSWDDTGLIKQIENNFKNYCFFGFSALGSNPEAGKINALRPLRVEDPFLWLLHKRNLIKMK
ncbi:MAG: hypothetical protein LBI15_02855 [Dysgonamonadaceae bacterium]|jgi:DNA-directed RNA polymerase subunit RPC12/RpoP|nr:hypothetical protein [Dysgonamonadaceae bacterium]